MKTREHRTESACRPQMGFSARSAAWILLIAVAGCKPSDPTPSPAAVAALDGLLTKMNERLALMEAVARHKQAHGLPVADPEREATMLDALEEKGKAYELSGRDIRWFFGAQIEAAKTLQEIHLKHWAEEKGEAPAKTVNLEEIRRRIDAVNDELLAALAEYRKSPVDRALIRKKAAELLTAPGVTDGVRKLAVEPLPRRE